MSMIYHDYHTYDGGLAMGGKKLKKLSEWQKLVQQYGVKKAKCLYKKKGGLRMGGVEMGGIDMGGVEMGGISIGGVRGKKRVPNSSVKKLQQRVAGSHKKLSVRDRHDLAHWLAMRGAGPLSGLLSAFGLGGESGGIPIGGRKRMTEAGARKLHERVLKLHRKLSPQDRHKIAHGLAMRGAGPLSSILGAFGLGAECCDGHCGGEDGGAWYDDLWHGVKQGVSMAAPLLPFIL